MDCLLPILWNELQKLLVYLFPIRNWRKDSANSLSDDEPPNRWFIVFAKTGFPILMDDHMWPLKSSDNSELLRTTIICIVVNVSDEAILVSNETKEACAGNS